VRTLFSILHYNLIIFGLAAKKYGTKIKGRKIFHRNMSFRILKIPQKSGKKNFFQKNLFFFEIFFLVFSQNFYLYVKMTYLKN